MISLRRPVSAAMLLSVSWCFLPASAAEPERCAALPTAAERIVCYDRQFPPESPSSPIANSPSAVDTMSSERDGTRSETDAAPIDVAASRKAETATGSRMRRLFDWPPRVREQSTIKAIRRRDGQNSAFLLENDQIWLQDSERPLPFRVGDEVTIQSGTFGGYFLTSDRGTKTRVRRIR